MPPQTEAFARAVIDAQLEDQGWKIRDGVSVRYEYTLADGDRADYLLCSREGRGLAVIEAKRESINAIEAAEQGRHNAEQADVNKSLDELGIPYLKDEEDTATEAEEEPKEHLQPKDRDELEKEAKLAEKASNN